MEIAELWNAIGTRLGIFPEGDPEIVKLAAAEGEFEVEAARSGKFKASGGQEVNITPALLSELAATFDPTVFRPVNKLGHPDPAKTDTPSMGPITGVRYDPKTDRLLAKVDPTADLRGYIKDKKFTERSIEYQPNWRGTGKARLIGLGWLGATPPAIDSLAALSQALDRDGTVLVMATGTPIAAADTGDDDDERVYYLRDFTAPARKKAASEGAALPDGSFPIYSQKDLDNAVGLAGHAKDPAAAKAHIRKRAKALGLKLPDSYKAADVPPEDDMSDEQAVKLAEAEKELTRMRSRLRDTAKSQAKAFIEANRKRIPMALDKAFLENRLVALLAQDADAEKTVKFAGAEGKEVEETPATILMALLAALPEQVTKKETEDEVKPEDAIDETADDEGMDGRMNDSTGFAAEPNSAKFLAEAEEEQKRMEKDTGKTVRFEDAARRIASKRK